MMPRGRKNGWDKLRSIPQNNRYELLIKTQKLC